MEYEKRCQWCGKVFKAQKVTTRYCSHRCNERAYKQKLREQKAQHVEEQKASSLPTVGVIGDKPYLSPSEVALLLGVSRATVYRSLASGEIKGLQYKRKCIIRRADLEKLFDDAAPYQRRSYRFKTPRQDYTMAEITKKYDISRKVAKGRLDKLGILPVVEGRNTYYDKEAVDVGFSELLETFDYDSYYTAQQIMDKFAMTKVAVMSFVKRHKIPRKTWQREVYYSKPYIDSIKITGDTVDPNYYTYEEIKAKYGFTKDQASYYVNTYFIDKIRKGLYTFVSRVEFDKVMKMRMDGTLKTIKDVEEMQDQESASVQTPEVPEGYLTADQIAAKYNLTLKYARNVARVNKIPSIRIKQFNYYEPQAVEQTFSKYKAPEGINEWLTRAQIEVMYDMTTWGVRSFVHRHKIPCKNLHGETLYSKVHIDDVKEFRFTDSDNYLSVEQLMEKYGISRHIVYNYARYYKVQKVKKGQFTFFLKADFEKIMKDKKK